MEDGPKMIDLKSYVKMLIEMIDSNFTIVKVICYGVFLVLSKAFLS